jgi:hypothetical protein
MHSIHLKISSPPSVIRETGMMILTRVVKEPLGQRLTNYQVPFPEGVKKATT